MSFKVPNQFRVRSGVMGSDNTIGLCGAFDIPWPKYKNAILHVIASDGNDRLNTGWEHVSVHGQTSQQAFTPTWEIMCFVKSLFWDDEDCVIQYHPPKSQYVNRHPHVLHLWRKANTNIETPPKELIG